MRGFAALQAAILIFSSCYSLAPAQSSWQFANRLQIGGEHDDNIYESSNRAIAAVSSRLFFRSRADRAWQKTQLAFTYAGGLQAYSGYADENKLANELDAELRWHLSRWCEVIGTLQGTIKIYFDGPFDFATSQSALHVALQLPRQWLVTVSTATYRLDYAESDGFDYLSRSAGMTVRRQVMAGLVGEGGIYLAWLRYLRSAYAITPNDFWIVVGNEQQDGQTSALARLIIGRRFLVQLTGEFQRNTSNSFGYDYHRWRLSVIGAFRLSSRWLVRLAGLRQYKKYQETLPSAAGGPPIELDTERNESNFVVADVSYDISGDLGWLVRAAFYDNEAAVRGLFYQKTLLFSGFEYRF